MRAIKIFYFFVFTLKTCIGHQIGKAALCNCRGKSYLKDFSKPAPKEDKSIPFMVQIAYNSSGNLQVISGALISPDDVLTAAEPFVTKFTKRGTKCYKVVDPTMLTVYVVVKEQNEETKLKLPVQKIEINPHFNPTTHENNFALLRLESEVETELYGHLHVACLLGSRDFTLSKKLLRDFVWVAKNDSKDNSSLRIQETKVNFESLLRCRKAIWPPQDFPVSMICTKQKIDGSCTEKSGSLLVVNDIGVKVLAGIGSPTNLRNKTMCSHMKFYNKVVYQYNWIMEYSNAGRCDTTRDWDYTTYRGYGNMTDLTPADSTKSIRICSGSEGSSVKIISLLFVFFTIMIF